METRLGRYLAGKHIFYSTSTYGFRRVKHYKVMEYDLDARKYTVINYDVEGPIEYIEILDEKNIEVYVEVIPVEESSEEEEEEEEESALTLEEIKKMKQGELVKWCRKYHLFTNEWLQKTKQVSKMRPALAEKLGLEGSTLTDKEQKALKTKNAMAAFLKLANVLAITSRIPGFDHKNTAHAKRFMEEYREQNGKGQRSRSRKINLNVMRSPRRVERGPRSVYVRRETRSSRRPSTWPP